MNQLTTSIHQVIEQVSRRLKADPTVRGIAYLGAAATLITGMNRLLRPLDLLDEGLMLHMAVLPGGLLITAAFLRLEGRTSWSLRPVLPKLRQAENGALLGAATFLAVTGIAASRGWVSAPAWGWERERLPLVLQAVLVQTIGHLVVAWNEELVFRGYGFDTLRQAWGDAAAAGTLVLLFAAFHQLTPQVLLGQTALGAALMALRLSSDGIWLPLGYHWAWNVTQTAILGAPDSLPSLRPLEAHGPYLWLGRPGYPEPGLLTTLANLGVAGAVFVISRLRRHGSC